MKPRIALGCLFVGWALFMLHSLAGIKQIDGPALILLILGAFGAIFGKPIMRKQKKGEAVASFMPKPNGNHSDRETGKRN